jgi:ketosteroid isomerase-like protein
MGAANFADWLAICEVKARYCRMLDTKNWAGYADCFTEDLLLDTTPSGGYVVQGRDEAMKLVRSSIETAKTAHQVHNPEITFDADGADVIWAMEDRVVWSPEQAEKSGLASLTGWGHYIERYVKSADGKWRIARTQLTRLHMDMQRISAV